MILLILFLQFVGALTFIGWTIAAIVVALRCHPASISAGQCVALALLSLFTLLLSGGAGLAMSEGGDAPYWLLLSLLALYLYFNARAIGKVMGSSARGEIRTENLGSGQSDL